MSEDAFGAPGGPFTWSSSDKDFVTTALGASRVWATVGHGVVNEVYWPSTGEPQIRDLTFYLVGKTRVVDLKRERRYRLQTPKPYVPFLTITHEGDDYELELAIVPDGRRDVLLVHYRLRGPYELVVLLAPHLGGSGLGNTAGLFRDSMFAVRNGHAVALAFDVPVRHRSVGFVGTSDGWQDLAQHGKLTWAFDRAENGNVALAASVGETTGVLALGFAPTPLGASTLAKASLAEGFPASRDAFIRDWEVWGETLSLPRPSSELADLGLLSATVLKVHEDRAYPGALVASLSVPWGNSTDSLGGYHLVWPRDATLAAFALLAANQMADARTILAQFVSTQNEDGHWSQNYYPDGTAYWNGVQLDEAAFPVLLAAKLRELGEPELSGTPNTVRRALGFVCHAGPTSEQDRWEENPGVSPFSLAVAIAALVSGSEWLSGEERDYALALADDWNERLESFCYVKGTPLAEKHGVSGYYVRLSPPEKDGGIQGQVLLRNRQGENILASSLVSLDFSYLPRLGLRDARDPRIVDTIRIADAVLSTETPSGRLYHRYNQDGYGEHTDGSPFDGMGVGRLWPLLSGERGHLALQSGIDPLEYLETMRKCTSPGGLLPEQVWDAPPTDDGKLVPGRPSGSAMPLLWAHAEFLKLLVARESKRPIELLRSVEARYRWNVPRATVCHWRTEAPVHTLEAGRALCIEDRRPFTLHFGRDGWQRIDERAAEAGPFGMWQVRLPPDELQGLSALDFTRKYDTGWEGADHRVSVGAQPTEPCLPQA